MSDAARPITVVVADDVDSIREVLTNLLNTTEGVTVCATASDGDEAVNAALATRPDVVLMDLKMPRKDGLTAAKEILAAWPEARIVINSAFGDNSLVESALAAGVARYVTKDRRPAELISALLDIARAD